MRKIIFIVSIILLIGAHLSAEETPQQFEGFDLTGYGEGGKKNWDVQGDTADIVGNTIKINNITANSYGEDETMHLTAQNGTLDKISGNMLLEKDVVITTESGVKMVTDSLNWAREEDLVTTEDDVTITRDKMTAVGKGIEAQLGLSKAQLKKDVTVTMDVEDEKVGMRKITITCDGPLEIEYEKQTAIFNNNVVAVDGDRRLLADKLEVYFDTDTSEIKEMICTGHVQIYQGESASYSEKAIYKGDTQKVTLSGRPKLIFYTEGDSGVPFGN